MFVCGGTSLGGWQGVFFAFAPIYVALADSYHGPIGLSHIECFKYLNLNLTVHLCTGENRREGLHRACTYSREVRAQQRM